MAEIAFEFRDAKPTLRPLPVLVLPQVYMAVLLALRLPSVVRIPLSLPYLYAIYHAVAHFSCHHVFADYVIGTFAFFQILNIFPLAIFDDDVYYAKDPKSRKIGTHPFVRRVWFYLCILFNPRNTGWSTDIPTAPLQAKINRWDFVLARFRQAVFWLFVLAGIDSIHAELPTWLLSNLPAWIASSPSSVHSILRLLKGIDTIAGCFNPVAFFNLSTIIPSMFCVATGLFAPDPADWPDMFGPLSEAYTLRRFWGRFWHQAFRRYLGAFTCLVTRTFGLERGTFYSAHAQTFAAFLLSGVVHIGGDIMMLGAAHAGRSLPSFVRTATTLMVEDIVIGIGHGRLGLGRRADGKEGPSPFWRAVGYAWVLYFFVHGGLGYVSEAYEVDKRRWGWVDVLKNVGDVRW